MLDIKIIRDAPDVVEHDLKRRNEPDKIRILKDLIKYDTERREKIKEVEALRKERNVVTKEISEALAKKKDAKEIMAKAKAIPEKIKHLESRLAELDSSCHNLLLQLPNLLDKSVPAGKDDTENVEIRRWGSKEWDFTPKGHTELLAALGQLDIERGAKVAGHGFYYIKDKLVVLDLALQRFAIDFLLKKGFILIEPPLMLSRRPYEGVVDIKDFENVMYKTEGDDLYMIATSEHPMAAMHMDEVLDKSDLPVKLAGVSPCFRKEVGAHGKYTRGLFRMHHFNKIEQFVFCLPKDSWQLHEELQHNSEEMLRQLGIPHRVVNVCSGDIGSIAAKKYDIEFLMADGNYREIGSNSNCTDYQARSLNIKWREKEGIAPAGFVHTLNNTAIATSRAMIAVVEMFQRSDGAIDIPKALQPYTGFKRIE
jgi:seryl-tRNA synthetase